MSGEQAGPRSLVVDPPTWCRVQMSKRELAEALWYFANRAYPSESVVEVLNRIGMWRAMHGSDTKHRRA